MKRLIILLLLAIASNIYSQDWPVKKMVMEKKRRVAFIQIPAFSLIGTKALRGNGIYQELKLNTAFSSKLLLQRPEAIQVSIPVSNTETIVCDLIKFELGNIKFTENDQSVIENIKIPVSYRGIISGEKQRNIVTLSVNEDYISLIATSSDKTIQITKADETDISTYRLYDSKKMIFPVAILDCGTKDKATSITENGISLTGVQNRKDSVQNKCVNVFVDCFDSLYQWRGNSSQQTINYVYELFTQVATGYANEQINIQITTINVWTTADPYRGDTRENALADLSSNYKDNFWGNICVGLDFSINAPKIRSGLAGDIGRAKAVSPDVCKVYTTNKHEFCYNDLNYGVAVKNFPVGPSTTGQQVYLVMHEMGHLLGAHHTKWCGWQLTSNPDTYGTLDSCGAIEGSCPQGPPPTSIGATIMSYCVTDTTTNFVNFKNGFGLLPGNAIRNFVDQTQCIPDCLACLSLLKFGSNVNASYAVAAKSLPDKKIPANVRDVFDGTLNIPNKIKK